MRRTRAGQSTLEYSILIVIVIGSFIAMGSYVKRGFQGRWKATADDYGDQYDPTALNSIVIYNLESSSNTVVTSVAGVHPVTRVPGFFTNRIDTTNSVETKQGNTIIGSP